MNQNLIPHGPGVPERQACGAVAFRNAVRRGPEPASSSHTLQSQLRDSKDTNKAVAESVTVRIRMQSECAGRMKIEVLSQVLHLSSEQG